MTRRTKPNIRLARFCVVTAAAVLALFVGACVAQGPDGPGTPGDAEAKARAAASETPTRAQIAEIQRLLAEQGYDPGPVDGLMGPRTLTAIEQYRQDKGLGRSGIATRDLLAHLQSQPKAAPALLSVEAAAAGGYEVGDRYIYAGGITHDVVEIDGGRVKWRTSEGETFTAPQSVGLPVLEWAYGSWRGRNRSSRDAEASWPPARGATVSFDVSSQEWNVEDEGSPPGYASPLRWSCLNEGQREIEVPAGRFAVEAIICERWPVPAGDWHKRIWYYAPLVGHFVRRDDLDSAGRRIESLTLVAALPGGGKVVQDGLRSMLRNSLSSRARNEPAVWTDPESGTRYVVRVTRDFEGAGGKACRAYTISRAGSNRRRDFPGVSCYDASKKQWRAPGL